MAIYHELICTFCLFYSPHGKVDLQSTS